MIVKSISAHTTRTPLSPTIKLRCLCFFMPCRSESPLWCTQWTQPLTSRVWMFEVHLSECWACVSRRLSFCSLFTVCSSHIRLHLRGTSYFSSLGCESVCTLFLTFASVIIRICFSTRCRMTVCYKQPMVWCLFVLHVVVFSVATLSWKACCSGARHRCRRGISRTSPSVTKPATISRLLSRYFRSWRWVLSSHVISVVLESLQRLIQAVSLFVCVCWHCISCLLGGQLCSTVMIINMFFFSCGVLLHSFLKQYCAYLNVHAQVLPTLGAFELPRVLKVDQGKGWASVVSALVTIVSPAMPVDFFYSMGVHFFLGLQRAIAVERHCRTPRRRPVSIPFAKALAGKRVVAGERQGMWISGFLTAPRAPDIRWSVPNGIRDVERPWRSHVADFA